MRRLTSAPNPSPRERLYSSSRSSRLRAAVAEPHAVEAREIRRAFGRRDHIIGGDRQRQVRQADFDGVGAERQVYLQRIADERRVAGLQSVEELAQQADFQALERRVQKRRIIGDRGIDAGRIVGIEPSHDLQDGRRVCRRPGEYPGLIEARCECDHPVARHPAVRGLDPGDAGEGGRLTDRAAGIGAGGDWREPGGQRRRRPARGAPRYLGRIPGILDRPVIARLVGGAHGKFVHVGLAEHDRTGRLEARDDGGIVGRCKVVEHARTAAGADPVRAENIFMNEGDAEQAATLPGRQAAIGRRRAVESLRSRQSDHGVQSGVQPVDPRQKMPRQLHA